MCIKRKINILIILCISFVLVGCNNNEKELNAIDEEASQYINFVENEKKQVKINEEEFFEIAFKSKELITKSNDLFVSAENLLNDKNVVEFNKFVSIVKEEKIENKDVEEIEKMVNEMTMHPDNEKYNEALTVVKKNLLDGLNEYKESLVFINDYLLVLFEEELIDEEEILELENKYKESYNEQQVVFNGNIEQMQNNFAVGNENFVYFVGGQFEKDYYPTVFTERLTKYFSENEKNNN